MGGRPSKYTEELGQQLFYKIATTMMGVQDICKELGIGYSTVLDWIANEQHPFSVIYTRAKKVQGHTFEDNMLSEAFNRDNDVIQGVNGLQGNAAAVQRSKLIVDTMKWQMSKTNPKKYGDKLELQGDADNPLNIAVTGFNIHPIKND